MDYAEAVGLLEQLYATLPTIQCQGLCMDSCGPLALSALERRRLSRATPLRTRKATGAACPLLRQGRCTVYKLRPLICRAYACAETMPCPFGCVPDRWLSYTELMALLHTVEEISQTLFPGIGTVSLHAPLAIVQAQERSAEALCAVLGQVGG